MHLSEPLPRTYTIDLLLHRVNGVRVLVQGTMKAGTVLGVAHRMVLARVVGCGAMAVCPRRGAIIHLDTRVA